MGSSSTLDEHPCYNSYDDGYDNFDSFDDFDLKAWGKSACLHTYRTERRSGGQRSAGGVYSTKHIRLAGLDETNGLLMEENNLTITI